MKQTYFISGIDTDAGKTYATGWLARKWREEGKNVITQKLIQTGCQGISEDIEKHRHIMGIPLLPEDLDGTSCPLVYTYPASPHLASRLDNKPVDLTLIQQASRKLLRTYDIVLLEGAGGLMVPLKEDYLTIDYITEHDLPLIFVTSAKLGSINHTLLSLDACLNRGIKVHSIIFNHYPAQDTPLLLDTQNYLKNYLSTHLPDTLWMDLPVQTTIL